MLLIDELYDIKKLFSATAVVNVKEDSFFVNGHFPGQPVMPGVLIVESFGQAAAALTAHGLDKSTYENKLVFLMGVEKARFRNPVIPNCKLILKIEAIRSHGRVWEYKGDAFVADKKMAGWQYTDGEKDAIRRLSPSLIDWDDLSESEKQKDVDAVEQLPELLAIIRE